MGLEVSQQLRDSLELQVLHDLAFIVLTKSDQSNLMHTWQRCFRTLSQSLLVSLSVHGVPASFLLLCDELSQRLLRLVCTLGSVCCSRPPASVDLGSILIMYPSRLPSPAGSTTS